MAIRTHRARQSFTAFFADHRAGLQRALVTVIAATVAWSIGSVFSEVDALVAAIVAILTLRISIQDALAEGLVQLLATAIGIGTALATLWVFGDTVWALSITVAAGLAASVLLRVSEDARLSVLITSIIVIGPGMALDTAGHRAWGTFLGVSVALAASWWAHPLTPAQRAERKIANLSRRTADVLEEMASGLREGYSIADATGWLEDARSIDRDVEQVRPAVSTASGYARWSPWASREEADLVATRLKSVEHASIQVRLIARTLLDAAVDGTVLTPRAARLVGDTLDAAAEAVHEHASGETDDHTLDALHDVAHEATGAVRSHADDTQELLLGAGVLTTVQQLAGSLDAESPAIAVVADPPADPGPGTAVAAVVRRPLRALRRRSPGSSAP